MQAIMEPIFHVFYLTTVIVLGITMYRKGQSRYFKLFGIMAIVLGLGDSFHLIPRIYALLTTGLENHPVSLGFGKLVTSITMTIFYLILYRIWKIKFSISDSRLLDGTFYVLAVIRVVLSLLPQNQWLVANPPVIWGIYRNIPFAIMGAIIIYLLYRSGVQYDNSQYKKMSLAVFLSFAFYAPVVLWASENFLVGMLMIPKTIAYLWIVFLGYKEMVKEKKF